MSARNTGAGAPNDNPLARTLAAMVVERTALPRENRTAIEIAGESGSGKSTTAHDLVNELEAIGIGAELLNQDNYFIRPPRTNHEYRVGDLTSVGPHEVNLELLQSHVDAFLRDDANVEGPLVDYPANRFVTQTVDFSSARLLVVEGTYVFRLRGIALRLFLEATHLDTRERRRVRNRDIDAPIIDRILAIEHEIIARDGTRADIVVDRDFAIRRT